MVLHVFNAHKSAKLVFIIILYNQFNVFYATQGTLFIMDHVWWNVLMDIMITQVSVCYVWVHVKNAKIKNTVSNAWMGMDFYSKVSFYFILGKFILI